MSRLWFAACLALAVAGVPGPGATAPKLTTYKCTTATAMWVRPPFLIFVDEATGRVWVMDGFIYTFNDKKPLAAKVSENTDAKLVFEWKIIVPDSKGVRALMLYDAAYFKKLNRFTVNGHTVSYNDKIFGQGKCEILKN